MCANASSEFSNLNTLSITGFILFSSIAKFILLNIAIDPTKMPCNFIDFIMIGRGLNSASFPAKTPIRLISPPTRVDFIDWGRVLAPPSSMV